MKGIKDIKRLTVGDTLEKPLRYVSIKTGLMALPCGVQFRSGRKLFPVYVGLQSLAGALTYGQRIALADMPEDDGAIMLKLFGTLYGLTAKETLKLKAAEAYPIAGDFITSFNALLARESKLLYRKPTKDEEAAGVDKLTKFGNLQTLIFLQQSYNEKPEEVMERKYEDCLVRLMLNREQQEYQERYTEMIRERNKPKKK